MESTSGRRRGVRSRIGAGDHRLGRAGFTVAGEAGNGSEALEMIRRDPPDLVLADIVMPEMDGVELLRRTREEGYRSRFIMLTCIGEFEYVRQAMEYGASNYILKLSMSVNSLRDTLRKMSAEPGQRRCGRHASGRRCWGSRARDRRRWAAGG